MDLKQIYGLFGNTVVNCDFWQNVPFGNGVLSSIGKT